MHSYKTTNLRIQGTQLKQLKKRAFREGKSASAIMRELIDTYLAHPRTRTDRRPLSSLSAQSIKTGDATLSSSVDDIMYGR